VEEEGEQMKIAVIFGMFGFILLFATGCNSSVDGQSQQELTIFAAANLTEAFTEMEQVFEEETGIEVIISFAGSQILRTQIEQGAPADVFASADLSHMEALFEQELVEKDQPLSYNNLVLIVPKQNPAGIDSLKDLGDITHRLIVGVEDVPIGIYTRDVLDNAGEEFGLDFKENVLKNVVSLETNVKQVVGKIALGEGDAGIVYVSDLIPSIEDKVIAIDIPEEMNVTATNTIAVVRDTEQPELAEQWIDFVLSEQGQNILEKHNYIKVTK
jgi:molybdate transport system substrate-binding protein